MTRFHLKYLPVLAALFVATLPSAAQQPAAGGAKPQDTEVWEPVPKVVTPGATNAQPPSDAVVLFDGKLLERVGSRSATNRPRSGTSLTGS